MNGQTNPLRCETCDFWDKAGFEKDHTRWVCNKIKNWFTYPEVCLISKIGCSSHSSQQGHPESTTSELISENARIGAELKRITERAELLSGEHDDKIRAEQMKKILDELIAWLEPQKLPLLKQRMFRKLESMRGEK